MSASNAARLTAGNAVNLRVRDRASFMTLGRRSESPAPDRLVGRDETVTLGATIVGVVASGQLVGSHYVHYVHVREGNPENGLGPVIVL